MVATLVGVRVSSEDSTCSLMPIGASIPDEDHLTHGRSRSLVFHSPVRTAHGQPLLNLLRFSLSTHHASEKAVVKGRIMSST